MCSDSVHLLDFIEDMSEANRFIEAGSEYIDTFSHPENFPLRGLFVLRETSLDYSHESIVGKPLGYYLPHMSEEFIQDTTYGLGEFIKKLWQKIVSMMRSVINFVFGTGKTGDRVTSKSLKKTKSNHEKKMKVLETKLKKADKVKIANGLKFYIGTIESAKKINKAFEGKKLLVSMEDIQKALASRNLESDLKHIHDATKTFLTKASTLHDHWDNMKKNAQIAKKKDEVVDKVKFEKHLEDADDVYMEMMRNLDAVDSLKDINEKIQKIKPPKASDGYSDSYIKAWSDLSRVVPELMKYLVNFNSAFKALGKGMLAVTPQK